RLPLIAQRPRGRLVITGLILIRDLPGTQVFDERPIPAAFGAVSAGARIELAMRQAIERLGRPGDRERAAVEAQGDGIGHWVDYTRRAERRKPPVDAAHQPAAYAARLA